LAIVRQAIVKGKYVREEKRFFFSSRQRQQCTHANVIS
jgi:hypothetical protein